MMRLIRRCMLFALILTAALAASGCASLFRPTVVNSCFNPGAGCNDLIAAEIAQAETEVFVQAYALTSKSIADALVAARDAGVSVEIILDRSYTYTQNSASYFSTMKGIPTYLDTQHTVARNNIILIDRNTVLTGSISFTNEADDRNSENLVIIRSASAANDYLQEWEKHKTHSEEYKQETAQKPPKGKKKRRARRTPVPARPDTQR